VNGDIPVSGRIEPRPNALPEGVAHDMRFYAAADDVGLSARCAPCHWRLYLDEGHDLADLAELVRQHTGGVIHYVPASAAATAQLASVRLLAESFDPESDAPEAVLEQVLDLLDGTERS
jgi:hypothetical protein